jgi:hypothetical protein
MSRWFRWYEGTSEDAKFRVVARLSRVTVRDVIALWAFILEDAAHLDHRGVCKRNEDFMAATLDFDDGVVELILSSMEDTGMISVGHGNITVCNFSKRQFESDADPTAADRQKRKRERDKQASHASVTRDSRPPDTDTDTDTDTEADKKEGTRASALASPDDWPSDYREQFWIKYPNKVGKPAALKKLEMARKSGRVTWNALIAGLETYIRKTDDRPWCNPATWVNQQRWADQPAQVTKQHSPRDAQQQRSDDALEQLRNFNRSRGENGGEAPGILPENPSERSEDFHDWPDRDADEIPRLGLVAHR